MEVSELTGAQLDYWVAKAQGIDPTIDDQMRFMPSTDWSQGGPIIERERITISYDDVGGTERGMWNAYVHECDVMCQDFDSPLVAAMRAYVASKFGEEALDIPKP